MALTFPSSPTNGQVYTYSGKSWTWNGTAWTPNALTFTASRALASDSNGAIAASSVTTTELGYVSGVTSAIQTQLAAKASLSGASFTGSIGVASNGLSFSDSTVQVTAGVPSLTTIKSAVGASTSTSAFTSALTYRDALVPISGSYGITIDADGTNGITFPIGTSIDFYQSAGTGAVFIQGSGVTLQCTPGLKFRTTYSSATITKVASNTWLVYGDLMA